MLLNSAILEVAVGLFFVYFLGAVLTSHFNELFAGIVGQRARQLQAGIRDLIGDTAFTDALWTSPLISSMNSEVLGRLGRLTRRVNYQGPSYIASSVFARALLTQLYSLYKSLPKNLDPRVSPLAALLQPYLTTLLTMRRGGASTLLIERRVLEIVDVTKLRVVLRREERVTLSLRNEESILKGFRSLIDVEQLLNADRATFNRLIDVVDVQSLVKEHPLPNNADEIVMMLRALDSIQNDNHLGIPELSHALLSLLTQTEKTVSNTMTTIENWYDQKMERVSGAYKRWVQTYIFIWGFLMAVAFNLDTLGMGQALWTNPTLREAINAQATATVTATSSPSLCVQSGDPSLKTEISSFNCTRKLLDSSKYAGLPIGWGDLPQNWGGWLSKLAGILVTTFAISLGAPFWFDLLGRIANLRSAGRPPATTTPTEPAPPAPPAINTKTDVMSAPPTAQLQSPSVGSTPEGATMRLRDQSPLISDTRTNSTQPRD